MVEKNGVTRKVFEQFCYTKISTFPSAEQMKTAVSHSEWHGESSEYTQVDYVIDTFIDMVAGKTLNFAEMITEWSRACAKINKPSVEMQAYQIIKHIALIPPLRNVLEIIFPGKGYDYLVDLAFLFSNNPDAKRFQRNYLENLY